MKVPVWMERSNAALTLSKMFGNVLSCPKFLVKVEIGHRERRLTDELVLGPSSIVALVDFESSSHKVPSVSAECSSRIPEKPNNFSWSRLIISSDIVSSEVRSMRTSRLTWTSCT